MESLQGILERIVFENAETGYTIGRLSSREYPNELITVVGNLASANAGESVLLKGDLDQQSKIRQTVFRLKDMKRFCLRRLWV